MEPTQEQRQIINHCIRAVYPMGWSTLASNGKIKVIDIETNTLDTFDNWHSLASHLHHELSVWYKQANRALVDVYALGIAIQVNDIVEQHKIYQHRAND